MKLRNRNIYPAGLDAQKVKEIIAFYDQQTDEELAAAIALADDEEDAAQKNLSQLSVEELEEQIARLPVTDRLLLVTRVIERIRTASPKLALSSDTSQ